MLATLNLDALPEPVKIGVAPAMCTFPCLPFWGQLAPHDDSVCSREQAIYMGITKAITKISDEGKVHTNIISEAATECNEHLAALWGDPRETPSEHAFTTRRAPGHLRKG